MTTRLSHVSLSALQAAIPSHRQLFIGGLQDKCVVALLRSAARSQDCQLESLRLSACNLQPGMQMFDPTLHEDVAQTE